MQSHYVTCGRPKPMHYVGCFGVLMCGKFHFHEFSTLFFVFLLKRRLRGVVLSDNLSFLIDL